jgi:hypothetical protein
MTINQLLRTGGIPFTRQDAIILGEKIKKAAKSKSIHYTKVEELVQVNDYPEEFKEEMITIAIDHFKNKTTKK